MNLGELKAIEARASAATSGPWEKTVDDHGDGITEVGIWAPDSGGIGEYIAEIVTSERPGPDADFIAHARADVPALTAYIRQLIVKLADATGEVRDLQAELDKSNASITELADRLDYEGGGNR